MRRRRAHYAAHAASIVPRPLAAKKLIFQAGLTAGLGGGATSFRGSTVATVFPAQTGHSSTDCHAAARPVEWGVRSKREIRWAANSHSASRAGVLLVAGHTEKPAVLSATNPDQWTEEVAKLQFSLAQSVQREPSIRHFRNRNCKVASGSGVSQSVTPSPEVQRAMGQSSGQGIPAAVQSAMSSR